MKRILKIIGVLLGLGALALVLFLWIKHEPLPEGKTGAEAEALAQKMSRAMSMDAYQQTRYLEWSYRNGAHQYKWDKQLGKVEVRFDGIVVDLNLNEPKNSEVSGKGSSENTKEALIEKALKNFNNDSFWLVAPYKIFDPGTTRSVVVLEDGRKGLLVTYSSGGTTPGDSYLWLLKENGFPDAYKMWVNIIPIGGLEASWDQWIVGESGIYLPKTHKLGPVELNMGDVKGYN